MGKTKKQTIIQMCFAMALGLWVFGIKPSDPGLFFPAILQSDSPYKPDVLWVAHDAIDSHKIDVKMADWYFTVPVNRADTIFQENQYQPGEIDGFTIVGNWPGFHARSADNIGDFRGLTNERIIVSIRNACPVRSNNDSVCTPKRWMEIVFNVHASSSGPGIAGHDFFKRSDLSDITASELAGYELVGFIDEDRQDNKILGSVYDLNIYRRIDENGMIDFAKCSRKTEGHSCKHHFIWRDFFEINVRYAVQYRSQWPEIKKEVLSTLDGMITPAGDYVPPTPPWCDRIPFPRPPELRVPASIKNSCSP